MVVLKLVMWVPIIYYKQYAYLRIASAQVLQFSKWACFSQSSAHAVQTSLHKSQIYFAKALPLDIARIANRQTSAHSWTSLMQFFNFLTSASFKHSLSLCKHSDAQSEHVAIQVLNFFMAHFYRYLLWNNLSLYKGGPILHDGCYTIK